MFPTSEWNNWLSTIKKTRLYVHKQLLINPSTNSNPNRIIGIISKKETNELIKTDFTIYDADKKYTEEMRLLLRDYYLAF